MKLTFSLVILVTVIVGFTSFGIEAHDDNDLRTFLKIESMDEHSEYEFSGVYFPIHGDRVMHRIEKQLTPLELEIELDEFIVLLNATDKDSNISFGVATFKDREQVGMGRTFGDSGFLMWSDQSLLAVPR